jgi:hypothetical protein
MGRRKTNQERKIVSAYADVQLAQSVASIAKEEDRSVAQVAEEALKLYIRLPADTRDMLRKFNQDTINEETITPAVDALRRTLLSIRFEQSAKALADSIPVPQGVDLDDEDAVLDWAVEVSR